jgi:hypothetical protein
LAQFEGSVMTLSVPSFLAAATSAFMPPPAAAEEEAVAQLVPLPGLPLVLPLPELEELQPTVSSRLPATVAAAAIACLARKFPSQATVPASGDHDADLG